MDGAYCIRKSSLSVLTYLSHRSDGGFKVTRVIHGVEHPKYIYPIHRSSFYKLLHHVICVMTIPKNILAAKKHLLRSIRHDLLNFPNSLPRVFPQIANTSIKRSPAPRFNRPIPHLIQLFRNGQHVINS